MARDLTVKKLSRPLRKRGRSMICQGCGEIARKFRPDQILCSRCWSLRTIEEFSKAQEDVA